MGKVVHATRETCSHCGSKFYSTLMVPGDNCVACSAILDEHRKVCIKIEEQNTMIRSMATVMMSLEAHKEALMFDMRDVEEKWDDMRKPLV